MKTKVPLEAGAQRLIIATCEKGTVENIDDMRGIKGNLDKIKKENPNFVEIAAKGVFRVQDVPLVADAPPKFQITAAQKKRAELMKKRAEMRIGMPRVLNMYSQTPVFTGYFASLGIKAENIVYSDFTSEELYKEGAKRGAIDPCFPSKLGIPHVHNLLYKVHAKKPLDIIFFPMIDCLTTDLYNVQASRSCPTVATTPEAVKAAFIKEGDLFAEKGVLFLDTFVNLSKPDLLERQMYEQFKDISGLSPEENKRAVEEGYRALRYFDNVTMRGAAREVLEQLEREDRLGVVVLGRPYHNDPGVNHEILEEFQKLGYPVFAQDCLPIDDDIIWRLFGPKWKRARSRIRCRSTTCGRTRIAKTPAARCGPRSTWRAIPTWWRWSYRASSAATTRRFTRWWKRLWSTPARRISASRTSTRTSPPARSGSAWRPSATS